MGTPATKGVLRSSIADMEIGDYIVFNWTGSGTTYDTNGIAEIPITGQTGWVSGEYVYMVKVDKGLLIGDRVTVHSKSWDYWNENRFIQGKTATFNGDVGIIRSLTGGVAYADENDNTSLTDLGFGATPRENEWDTYIVNFPQELIQDGKTIDDVFHWRNCGTWTQDTLVNGFVRSDNVTVTSSDSRMLKDRENNSSFAPSSWSSTTIGFRPVFEYKE